MAFSLTGIGVLTSFTVYYLAYSEPDIRALRAMKMVALSSECVVKKDGGCFYNGAIIQRFKNVSIKSGHIDRATITNWSDDALPEYNVVEVDKDQLGWGDEKDVQLRFNMTLDQTSVAKMNRNEPLEIEIRFYDNTGKLLNRADDDLPIYFYASISPNRLRTFQSQSSN